MIWKWVRYPNQGHRALEQATESGVIQPAGQPRRGQGGQGRAALFRPDGCDTLPLREGLQCFCGFQGEKRILSSTTMNIILILAYVSLQSLAANGVAVVGPVFINDYLVSDTRPKIEDCLVEDFKTYWHARRWSQRSVHVASMCSRRTSSSNELNLKWNRTDIIEISMGVDPVLVHAYFTSAKIVLL